MKKHVDRMAKYTALILISSLPFSVEVFADSEKEQLLAVSSADAGKDTLKAKTEVTDEMDQ